MYELFSDDPARIDAFVRQWDVPGRAVYACINPLKPGSTRRCIENVARIERLHVDIDFKDLAEPPDEVDTKLLHLPVQATVVRDSGGGRHAIHELKEPIEADDPEMFGRACDLTKRLTSCLSGDPLPAHPAALLRVDGTHNTKRGEPILVKPLWGSGTPVDLTDLEDMVDQLPEGGIFTRKPPEAQAPGSATITPRHTPGVPVDIEARLATMQLGAGGLEGVHITQLDCARAMMETGSSVEFAVDFILEATRAAVGDAEFSRWNVAKERLWLEEKCYSWVAKNPRLSATLPKGLREQFEAKHARGEEPVIIRDRAGGGWCARKKRGPNKDRLHIVGGTDTERPEAPPSSETPPPEPEPEFRPSALGWVLYDADDIQPTNWIVKNVLGESGVLILPGQWGVYKTTSLLQLSYSIMTGTPFAGEYAINLPGAIMLYALEAPKAVNARVKAIATFLDTV